MTHDKWRYWRDRMFDKLKSHSLVTQDVMEELLDNANHINLEVAGIKKAVKKLNEAYIDLEKAIMASRSKK